MRKFIFIISVPSLSFPHIIYIGDSKKGGKVKKLAKHFKKMVNLLFTEKGKIFIHSLE